MTRKSPIRHPVSSYTKYDGTRVDKYERGNGTRPRERGTKSQIRGPGVEYNVTLFFDDDSESHRIDGGSLTDAAYGGLRLMQKPSVPRRMRIKRGGAK